MAKLDELIQELCPDGVEYKAIGELITRSREKAKDYPYITTVYAVSNTQGLVCSYEYRENEIHSEDTSNYLVVQPQMFVYNPARLNIGSIAYLQDNAGLVSPMYVVFSVNNDLILNEYLFTLIRTPKIMNKICSMVETGARFRFDFSRWDNVLIPVPPLEIQEKIMSYLNKFKEYSAELTAELTARKKQYEYYRDALLTFDDTVPMVKVGYVATVTKLAGFEFTKYVNYSDEGNIIALRGLNVKNGALDLSDVKYIDTSDLSKLNRSKLHIGDMLFTYVGTIGQVALIDREDKYYLAPNVALIRSTNKQLLPEYMKYYFQSNTFWNTQINRLLQTSSMKNIPMEKIRKFEIHLPPLEEQERIVSILDRFDALCNDISIGLPAEIEARKKQYEHYRDMLLTFKEKIA